MMYNFFSEIIDYNKKIKILLGEGTK